MSDTPTLWTARRVRELTVLLGLFTLAFAVWPVYRAFLIPDISVNEPWNAYFADAAISGQKLYPARDQLITNNYPPLSYYLVGATGRLLGDTILAGRLLSIAAIAWMAWVAARLVRFWGGDTLAGWIGGLFCASSLLRFFPGYAGMNDPQLLAQAVMASGFLGFLKAIRIDRAYLLPLFAMVLAGFIKHNIVVMPLVAFAWLACERPRRLLPLAAASAGIVAAGFALCHIAYGTDFWMNMKSPRSYRWGLAIDALAMLQWPIVGLVVWLYVGVTLRKRPAVRFCNLWVGVGLGMFLIQKASEGVAENAMFDLLLALSVASGVAFTHACEVPLARIYPATRLQSGVVIAFLVRLATAPGNEAVRLAFDPVFRGEIARREGAMRASVAKVRGTPGEVLTAAAVSYRAGKPFVVDMFNFQQRVKAGQFPATILDDLVAEGRLTRVVPDPLHAWCNPLEP
jgi:hypothetical protein